MSHRLEKRDYPSVGEEVYQTVLKNGLRLAIIPKPDYHETYGIVTTKFGAVDTNFTDKDGHQRAYPAGIAHFLEHKLFEREDGQDLLQSFVQLGAESNAFTGYARTSYLFSTTETEQVEACLDLLLELVGTLSLSPESVEHEKEIIGQEIAMYQDQPDSCLFYGALAQLYPHTPLAQDIAGSQESIALIETSDLRENFDRFYQPNNLGLVIVGPQDPQQLVEYLEERCQGQEDSACQRVGESVSLYPVVQTDSVRMEVASPKLAIGLRGKDRVPPEEQLRYKTLLRLLFAMLVGWTSHRFQALYEAGKIDHSLSLEVEVEDGFHFVMLTMDAEEPVSLSHTLRSAIRSFETDPDVTEEHLDTIKSEMFGDFLQGLNSLEYIATEYDPHREGENLFDLPMILQEIRLKDVLDVGRRFIENCDMIDFTIFPK